MKNKLALLGFLSLLGILGLVSENRFYVAFFAYAVFFRYWGVVPDELFKRYVEKSGARAFFAGIAFHVACVFGFAPFFGADGAVIMASTISTTAALMVFTFTLNHYENLEKRALNDED